ncbi:transmembrane protein 43 homolog isoform X1 [Hetaerina americana]|uniref:transmembrane protein 43 homolog isoform X1 n=1 Tax=Hetaerina americana TaxID=62018 RepID=UPI003A7F2681
MCVEVITEFHLKEEKSALYPNAPGPYHSRLNVRNYPNVKDQLKASWLAAVIGSALFSGGMWILFWNEGRAVQTIRSLEEGMSAVIPLHSTDTIIEEYNKKLVHLSGPLDISEPLTEFEYGVSVPAVKLKRRVQMYQWIEEENTREYHEGDHVHTETSYSYATEWRDKIIDSSSFSIPYGHHNLKEFPFKSKVYVSEHVSVGNFELGGDLKDKFNDFVLVTSDERPERRDIKLHAGLYYHSQDVWNPEVGDIRIQFSYAGSSGDVVTIVAMQNGNQLVPYKTLSGYDILILRHGKLSVEEIFHDEHSQKFWLTWLVRFLGWFLTLLGCTCLSNILFTAVHRYSILNDILTMDMGSFNLAVSLSVSLLIIGVAWIWYRPALGFILVLISAIPFTYSTIKLYRKDSQQNRYRSL